MLNEGRNTTKVATPAVLVDAGPQRRRCAFIGGGAIVMRVVAILDCAIVGDDEDAVAAAVAASDRQVESKVGRARWNPIDGVVALDGKVDGCTETIFTAPQHPTA